MDSMKLLIINGPNINMLGVRETSIYGNMSYKDLCNLIEEYCKEKNINIEIFQSNHEGEIVDKIQQAIESVDGIIINPAAYTHTSIAILDALKAVKIPAVEVHISDIKNREAFRNISYIRTYCEKSIVGFGVKGYFMAVDYFIKRYLQQ